jgi:hypothetical protein
MVKQGRALYRAEGLLMATPEDRIGHRRKRSTVPKSWQPPTKLVGVRLETTLLRWLRAYMSDHNDGGKSVRYTLQSVTNEALATWCKRRGLEDWRANGYTGGK